MAIKTIHNNRLLNESEATAALSVCRRTMKNLRDEGKLGFVRIGRAVRYRAEEIERFIEANSIKPAGWKKSAHVG